MTTTLRLCLKHVHANVETFYTFISVSSGVNDEIKNTNKLFDIFCRFSWIIHNELQFRPHGETLRCVSLLTRMSGEVLVHVTTERCALFAVHLNHIASRRPHPLPRAQEQRACHLALISFGGNSDGMTQVLHRTGVENKLVADVDTHIPTLHHPLWKESRQNSSQVTDTVFDLTRVKIAKTFP
jgi:hypothetical protein